MQNHIMNKETIIVMFLTSLIAGTMCGMNLFVNNRKDIRFNLNDVYMALAMTGMMFILMGIYYVDMKTITIGILIFLIALLCIRRQVLINQNNFINSMIPHHSMAIMMSKKIKDKKEQLPSELDTLLNNIISIQEQEIELMKKL
jgi:hypothetical protein